VDSGFGNSIYWTLPVVTTIIHFTSLQHTNQTCLFSPVSLQTSYLNCPPVSLFTLPLCHVTFLICICVFFLTYSQSESESELLYDWWFTANQFVLASASVFKTVFSRPSREHLIEGLSLSVVTKTTPPLCTKRLSTLL
jgi:hypothetical protein